MRRIGPALVLAGVLALASPAHAAVRPFGRLDCAYQQNVWFCQGSIDKRVKSFDGVPLDVDVTLPPISFSPLPLVIQLHGWGGLKGGLGESAFWAQRGYAVLNYSARGFGDSCGSEQSRAADPQGCAKGWVHFADSRYEVRDSQYLAGLLADEGLVRPRAIAVTGVSYGAGEALELATLRNRVRLEDGTLVPWVSPGQGLAMRVAAAAPITPWSDLVYSLAPNGRTLDYALTSFTDDLQPFGLTKETWSSVLWALGLEKAYLAPPGVDASADVGTWAAAMNGETDDAVRAAVVHELAYNHSAYYLTRNATPAPTLIANGFTDDLFSAAEGIRYANSHPQATLAQMYFDFGHTRGQSKPADMTLLNARIADWFDRYAKGDTTVTPLTGVEALTQTCPASAPSDGPFDAPSWQALHPGEARFEDAATKTIVSSSDSLGPSVDPLVVGTRCVDTDASDQAGTATYRLPAAIGGGYTLLGSPTVIADLQITPGAAPSETAVVARLWDVAPGGTQTLVGRGAYRPASSGRAVFQLAPNGWRFAPGHVPKLELLGRDSPYLRPPSAPFTIGVSNLELRLPTHDAPDGGQVEDPLPPVLPPGATAVP